MSEPKYLSLTNYREWAVSTTFGPLDAGFDAFLFHVRSEFYLRARRSSLSSASARYLVRPRQGHERAWIDFRMVDAKLTLILLNSYPAGSRVEGPEVHQRWHEQMCALVDEFLTWFDQEHARIAALTASGDSTHPLDRVLAEYEHRRATGEKLSMREIAEERKVSYDSLRKRSAAQKKAQNAQ